MQLVGKQNKKDTVILRKGEVWLRFIHLSSARGLKSKVAASQGDDLLSQAVDVNGVKVLTAKLEGVDAKGLRDTLDQVKNKLKSGVIVLAVVEGEKVQIAAGVTADLISRFKAGEVVNHVAQQVGGKGGGKPDMAMAGGTNPAGIGAALASVAVFIKERTS